MPVEDRRAKDVLLGLDGFRLVVARLAEGEVELAIETVASDAWCATCGVRAHSKGRYDVVVRDLDCFDRWVRLRWPKRRWRRPEPAGPAGSWTEQSSAIRPRRSVTERVRAEACRRVGREAQTVAAVARAFATGWHTIMAAVWDYGQPAAARLRTR